MPKFTDGVRRFQAEVFPKNKSLFETLSLGQKPEALFITCADSRIETAMITQTDPGDLFVCRNAGNIVPPHSNHTGATTATIEFGVAALKIPHIVVCGHTECGAMKGALNLDGLDTLPHIRDWLGFARAAVEIVRDRFPNASPKELEAALLEQNVMLQLQHLKTHPSVAVALANGSLTLHGWVYDIRTGAVRAYDSETGQFTDFETCYQGLLDDIVPHDCAAH